MFTFRIALARTAVVASCVGAAIVTLTSGCGYEA
jgi:hypothetical protein